MPDVIRLLLVEDNPADARLLQAMLGGSADPRFELTHVERLGDAQRQVELQRFQAVLLDLSLPDAQGLQGVVVLHEHMPGLPIVVLTGSNDEALAVDAVRQGAQDYLVKGKIDSVLLTRTLRYAIERNQLEGQLRHAQKMETIGRLAGGLAHDFNNLLTVAITHTDLMRSRLHAGDPLLEHVTEVEHAAEQAIGLTRQLLAFSRQQVLTPRVLDLNHVVSRMVSMMRRLIGEDIELSNVLQMGLGLVQVDPGQIKQVILNLILNARDAMPQGGKLTIETKDVEIGRAGNRAAGAVIPPGDYVLLAIGDTGGGMDAVTQAHLFEPFFTTKPVGQGTGLGLATVYGIVQQSGGFIQVESAPGDGATFRILLPRAHQKVADADHSEPVAAAGRGFETILLVEDYPSLRAAFRSVLQSKGYQVLDASDGIEALDVAGQHGGPLHLLVTDIVMPKLNGRDLAAKLLALRPGLRVLFMSGYPKGGLGHPGVTEAEISFLEKPFNAEALARKVREVLNQAAVETTTSGR